MNSCNRFAVLSVKSIMAHLLQITGVKSAVMYKNFVMMFSQKKGNEEMFDHGG